MARLGRFEVAVFRCEEATGDRRAPANAVLKRVKVPSAELAVCGSDGSVTASPRGGVESNRSKTARP